MLLHNARIINELEEYDGYVAISGEFITEVGCGNPSAELLAQHPEAIDLQGKYLIPGMIDTHVHFRDPGLTHKGDMESESKAGVAGGVTSFIDMPNTNPATVTRQAVDDKQAHAAQCAWSNYAFYIGATNSNIDELLQADYSHIPGVKLFLGSSTGKMAVSDADTVERIFRDVPALIAVHAEDDAIISENKARVIEETGSEDPDVPFHPVIRDEKACLAAAKRAVDLARKHNARLHLLHLSTPEELDLFEEGKMEGKRITSETCMHYLAFSADDYAELGSRIKCNPAIKKNAVTALEQGLQRGKIDVIGSDHAPHLLDEKKGGALKAPSGMPGIETTVPFMFSKESFRLPLGRIVELLSHNPARLFGIDRRGFIRPGYYADLAVVEELEKPVTVTDSSVHYKCGWTPYAGQETYARVALTIVNGQIAYPFPAQRPHVHPLSFRH